MLTLSLFLVFVTSTVMNTVHCASDSTATRPFFEVPTLLQVRNILAALEAPIVTTMIERFSLPVDPSVYNDGKNSQLGIALAAKELGAEALGRYQYGTLEYPFTLPPPAPDVATANNTFPPGRFHQDGFFENSALLSFYTETIIPMFSATAPTSFYFHFSNGSSTPGAGDKDAALDLDVTLLQLLSHRCHIGKSVAESKYLGNTTGFTALIQAQDATSIQALLTNVTQEQVVLAGAQAAASALTTAWANSGQTVFTNFASIIENATAALFGELIDLTTTIEVQYLLERL